MIGYAELTRAVRAADTAAETIGLEAFIDREGITLDDLIHVAQQRALRAAMVAEGRHAEIVTSGHKPISLPRMQVHVPMLIGTWLDGFAAGFKTLDDRSEQD